jgi:hypothetical protein
MNITPCLCLAGVTLLAGTALARGPTATPPNGNVPPESSKVFKQPPTAVPTAPTAVTPATGLRLDAEPLSQRQYQDLAQGVVTPPLAERLALFSHNVGRTLRVSAIGAPVAPMMGESRSHQEQVRVPVVSVTW